MASFRPSPRKDFEDYRAEFGRLFAESRIAEPSDAAPDSPPDAARVDERLAQCIWFDSLLLHDGLRTDSGKPLRILHPGQWNHAEGPDFSDAKLEIDGRRLTGPVEVHLHATGWRHHGHHLDPRYDDVLLDARLWDETPPQERRAASGRVVESFVMAPVLFPDLDSIRQTVRVEDYPYQTLSAHGRCRDLMCSLEESFVSGMLAAAGRERLRAKAARFADQAQEESLHQVFYQAAMTALGHKANKSLFFLLSKRVPLAEIADYMRDLRGEAPRDLFVQSLLLHVAGLAPAPDAAPGDPESQAMLRRLRQVWRRAEPYFSDRLMPPTKRWNAGVRPPSFAFRRIAGAAHLILGRLLRRDLLESFAAALRNRPALAKPRDRKRWMQRELVDPFIVDCPEDFWARRYSFTAKPAARAMKLIGAERAASIALNVLLPLLLLHAERTDDGELEQAVYSVFDDFPPLEENAVVRHMRARLFGGHPRAETMLAVESRRQGLFQIFGACCNWNEEGCGDCWFLERHRAPERTSP